MVATVLLLALLIRTPGSPPSIPVDSASTDGELLDEIEATGAISGAG
jgi:hypothetical protein